MARAAQEVLEFLRRTAPERMTDRDVRRGRLRDLQHEIEEVAPTRDEALRLAMLSNTKVWATYRRKRDGQELEYTLAPYEVGEHPTSGRPVLWATDHKHPGTIHAFLLSRLSGVENRVMASFRPKWPVQPDSV